MLGLPPPPQSSPASPSPFWKFSSSLAIITIILIITFNVETSDKDFEYKCTALICDSPGLLVGLDLRLHALLGRLRLQLLPPPRLSHG